MRQYRVYKNINWGPLYNPKTQAHHCEAENAEAAAQILNPPFRDGFQSMQILLGDGWAWVTDTPLQLGGVLPSASNSGASL